VKEKLQTFISMALAISEWSDSCSSFYTLNYRVQRHPTGITVWKDPSPSFLVLWTFYSCSLYWLCHCALYLLLSTFPYPQI